MYAFQLSDFSAKKHGDRTRFFSREIFIKSYIQQQEVDYKQLIIKY